MLPPQQGLPVPKEGPQNWQNRQMLLHLRAPPAHIDMCSWAQRGHGVLAHPCLTPNGPPTALGCNGWPCFHLNRAFRSQRRVLKIGKIDKCCSISGHRQRILTCVPGHREAMECWHILASSLMDLQQLWAAMGGLASTPTGSSDPKEGSLKSAKSTNATPSQGTASAY